jgi:superfamily II DNA or RNA helicase
LNLRSYQQRAIDDLRAAFRQGARAPLLVAPTGAGKTVILAAITASATARGRKVLILVHRRELIHQASSKLTAAGVEHGIIAAGVQRADATVQIASVQTLVRRLATTDWEPCLIIIDEAHHAAAGSWSQIISHWPGALRLGVTATPCRLDGRGLIDSFDALIEGPSVQMLTSAGYLSPARIFAPPIVADLSQLRRRAGDYANDQAAAAMTRPTVTGDAISHYQRLAGAQQAIAFCCNVAHAESVRDAFETAGISAALLLGGTADRDGVVAAFAAGAVRVLVTVDVVSEGFDIPAASVAILLRPTQSLGLYLQQVGRVLRPAPGKEAAIILDHVGNVTRHGFPDDIRQWSLEHGARPADGSQPAPSVRTCSQCFAAFKPAPICPCCGFNCVPDTHAIRVVDGELVEVEKPWKPRLGEEVICNLFRQRYYFAGITSTGQARLSLDRLFAEKGECSILEAKSVIDRLGHFAIVNADLETLEQVEPSHVLKAARREQGKAQTLQQLIHLGQQRGMKNPVAWAKHVLYARSLKDGQRRNHPAAADTPSGRFPI